MKNTDVMEDVVEIDVVKLLKALLHRAWAVILAVVVFASGAFVYTRYLVTPMYRASVLMYVNSSDISVGGTKLSISQSDLMAAQSLVDTYAVILKTRTTLNDVIEKAQLGYDYETLVKNISAAAVNGTEVFQIDVVDANPEQATLIANTIAQVLPEKISSIVEGTSARIVDMAVVPHQKDSPSTTKNVLLGAVIGFVLACGIVVVQELIDDKIHDSDYLMQAFDLPVLAVIPDLLNAPRNSKYYYKSTRDYLGGE